MKKILMGTSAIALAGAMTSQASAAEWNLKWGGFMESYVSFSSVDINSKSNPGLDAATDFDGVDPKTDGEIIFAPSITLDNGVQFGANVQLETNFLGNTDRIDESYIFIKGSFGEVLIGSENSAGYKMHYAAPDVSFLNVNSGTISSLIPFSGNISNANGALDTNGNGIGDATGFGSDVFRRTLGTTYLENDGNNDSNRITYFSPRFAGFQVGASYARTSTQDILAQQDRDAQSIADIFDIGANYVNSFGAIDVAVSGRWGIADNPQNSDNPEIYSFGLNLGFAGFTVGGSFAEQNESGAQDGRSFDVGVSYETGPWGVSFTYQNGENVDNEAPVAGADEELDLLLGAVSYDIAKGVDANLWVGYADFDEEVADDGTRGGDDLDGFTIGGGIRLRF